MICLKLHSLRVTELGFKTRHSALEHKHNWAATVASASIHFTNALWKRCTYTVDQVTNHFSTFAFVASSPRPNTYLSQSWTPGPWGAYFGKKMLCMNLVPVYNLSFLHLFSNNLISPLKKKTRYFTFLSFLNPGRRQDVKETHR